MSTIESAQILRKLMTANPEFYQDAYYKRYFPTRISAAADDDQPNFMRRLSKCLRAYQIYDSVEHVEIVPKDCPHLILEDMQSLWIRPVFTMSLIQNRIVANLDFPTKITYFYLEVSLGRWNEQIQMQLGSGMDKDQVTDYVVKFLKHEASQIIPQDLLWTQDICPDHIELDPQMVKTIVDIYIGMENRSYSNYFVRPLANAYPITLRAAKHYDLCDMCDRPFVTDRFVEPTQIQFTFEQQLMTVNGWYKCLLSSKYFPFAHPPSCPRFMRNFTKSVIWNNENFSIDDCCLNKVGRERVVLLTFRVLTFLRRDREVIQLLANQTKFCDSFEVPFPVQGKQDLFEQPMDSFSWMVVLTWIAETCSLKALFCALAMVPKEKALAVFVALDTIFERIPINKNLQASVIYLGCFMNDVMIPLHHGEKKQLSMTKAQLGSCAKMHETYKTTDPMSQLDSVRMIVHWFCKLLTDPDVRKPLISKHFVKRSIKSMFGFMIFESDIYLETANELLTEMALSTCPKDANLARMFLLETRLGFDNKLTRMWAGLMSYSIDKETLAALKGSNMFSNSVKNQMERAPIHEYFYSISPVVFYQKNKVQPKQNMINFVSSFLLQSKKGSCTLEAIELFLTEQQKQKPAVLSLVQ